MPHGNVQTIWYTHCVGTQSETKMVQNAGNYTIGYTTQMVLVQKCEVQY